MALISPVFTSMTIQNAPFLISYLSMAFCRFFSTYACTVVSMVVTRLQPSEAS